MGSATAAAYPDTRPQGYHPHPDTDLQKYTYDRLLQYWSMVYTLGLLGGVLGTANEQTAARDAILAAMEGAVKEAMGLVEAAGVALDDYTPPGVGAANLAMQRSEYWAAQKVGTFFGYDPGFKDDIENLDRSIRDSVAVDVNQTSQVIKGGKATVEWLGKRTGLYDYKADTTNEDKAIAATQATVDARHAQVTAALSKVWNALKETALARYKQFLSDWEKGGPSYAFGTLGIDGAFLALELAISAAAGALTAGAGAVAFRVAVSIGEKVGSVARKIVVTLKRAAGNVGKTARIELSEAKVVEHAKAHKGFGDDHAGLPRSTHDNVKDPGGPTPRLWKKKEIGGRTVYQRDDLIDPNLVDAKGRTNYQRMKAGLAPYGSDGSQIELHHMLQQETLRETGQKGPLAEVQSTFHSDNYNTIHIYPKGDADYISWRKLHPQDEIDYNNYRSRYWRARAKDFGNGPPP
ncbi:HNH/ENDO VII family nuclease [Rhizobium tumorigenes]|uniref:HNH/ENDO VII family nuclease n=1 Tax=Rhizobium tumorigenes TaxID=2041385 RepID=A0AAF1KAW9_9HYPH|nr:HNH/ENDO VII family nuclease [Rhizobium tumorigenes]WFR98759.1 HNH/ENDO VII family nuclease [Rhizobium tumorigenes]